MKKGKLWCQLASSSYSILFTDTDLSLDHMICLTFAIATLVWTFSGSVHQNNKWLQKWISIFNLFNNHLFISNQFQINIITIHYHFFRFYLKFSICKNPSDLNLLEHVHHFLLVLQNRRKFIIDYRIESAAHNRLYHRLFQIKVKATSYRVFIHHACTLKYKTIHICFIHLHIYLESVNYLDLCRRVTS